MVSFHGGPVAGDLDVRWIHGSPTMNALTDPPIQVHAYDPHTYLLRQSKTVSFEAPFMYLLFGNDRALLLDTGATREATRFPLRDTVDEIMSSWLATNPRALRTGRGAHSRARRSRRRRRAVPRPPGHHDHRH